VLTPLQGTDQAARRQILLVAGTQVAALATWFSASAVSPALQRELQLGAGQAALLTSSVQIGFVAGAVTSAALNLPDRVNPARLYGISALLAAGSTAAFPLLAHGAGSAVGVRILTGCFLAGVYPVGMKLVASWADPTIRGRAFGLLIGALTLGSALPHLIRGIDSLPWASVMGSAAALATVGGLVALTALRVGPGYVTGRQRLQLGYAVQMFRQRPALLANLGYFGHMWELYALWTWLPTYAVASQASREEGTGSMVGLLAFSAIGVAGALGCLVGGWASDRAGRAPTAIGALFISGACCLASPLVFGADPAILAVFLTIWGFAVIADSGVFSTALSESVEVRHLGTALTTQTAVGFCLTVVTIQLVPLLATWASWKYALVVLAVGPAVGIAAMARFTSAAPSFVPSPMRDREMESPEMSPRNRIEIGDSAQLTRTVGTDDIRLFTEISGDRNPLHYDAEAARASRFGEIVVQGGVTSAILNAVVAEELPGPGTVFLNVNWDFKAPVRPGDVITGHVEVTSVRQDKPITGLKTTVTRGDGTVVLDGTAVCYTMAVGPTHG